MMRWAWILVVVAFVAPAQAQLMEQSRRDHLRSLLPVLESREWHADLHSPAVVWYTEREIPRAYQHAGGFHSPAYNISADPSDANIRHGEGGNANVQFPWVKAGGLDRSPDAVTFTGLLLPPRANQTRWPVVVWNGTLPGHPRIGEERALRWMFPNGAVLFEVIAHPIAGTLVTSEVRARLRELDTWQVGLFRPFPSAKDLADVLTTRPDAALHETAIACLRSPQVQIVDISDRVNRTRSVFTARVGASFVPHLSPAVTSELMRRPFRDALGAEWARTPDGKPCYAPTSAAPDQIVPRHYMGSLIGVDPDSCKTCHETVAQHARQFDVYRGWYGHVRGDDDVFTFHPVEPTSISYNGATVAPRLRRALLDAGVVEVYDPARHPPEVYRLLSWPARRRL